MTMITDAKPLMFNLNRQLPVIMKGGQNICKESNYVKRKSFSSSRIF